MHLGQPWGPLLVHHASLQLGNKVIQQVYLQSLHPEQTILHHLLHLQHPVELQCLKMGGMQVRGNNLVIALSELC